MSKPRRTILISFFAFFFSANTNAEIINTYVDRLLFQTETGATSLTGAIPNEGEVGLSYDFGDMIISTAGGSTNLFVGTGIVMGNPGYPDWTTRTLGQQDIALSGDEDFNVLLDNAATSFGFDVVEPLGNLDGLGFSNNSVFEISLYSGGSAAGMFVGSDQFTLLGTAFTNPLVEFIGVTADTPFDFVTVREIVTADADAPEDILKNDYFGQFYTTAVIPIPASWWLFGSALIGLIGLNRKHH